MASTKSVTFAVLGDGFVGKTSFLKKFVGDEVNLDYVPTTFDCHNVMVSTCPRNLPPRWV